jgi:cellulose biosynthesis protein BcsQ
VPPVDAFLDFVKNNVTLSIVGTLCGIATALGGFLFTLYKATHGKQIGLLKERIAELESQLRDAGSGEGADVLAAELGSLQTHLESTIAEAAHLKVELENKESQRATQQQISQGLSADLETLRDEAETLQRKLTASGNRIKRALKLEGRMWEEKVLRGAPQFRPLSDRRSPILSLLNLKGGVGKTTLTAHLGSALSQRGYRVLMVDLDLQGSLSSLFIAPDLLTRRFDEKRVLQHLLLSAVDRAKTNLLEYAAPVLDNRSAIVPATDRLAYAELNLSIQWLLRTCRRDTRFLLRKALHQKRVTNRFDVILLDCPPLMNTCCVNALAASDYVLVPVLPSRKAAERVPQLLYELRRLCAVVNPDLQVAGLVANRTHSTVLTAKEQDIWGFMLRQCQDRWEQPVHAFQTVIRQNKEVQDTESEFVAPGEGSELRETFHRLAAELEARLPGDCRRTATTLH